MSNLARPGQMAQCDDHTLFGFIASKLMAQDVSLAEEGAIDEEFATYLSRSNSVQKSLAAAMARTASMARATDGVLPPRMVPAIPRSLICPKCHFGHLLKECTAEFATMYKNGPAPEPRLDYGPAWSGQKKGRRRTPCPVRWTTGPLGSVGAAAGNIRARYL
jgi:hypothetical protein